MWLYITRHGETRENRQHIITGRRQGTLSAAGVQQALQLGAYLRAYPLAAVFASDLYRAVVTAQIAAAGHESAPIQYLPVLREMDFGAYTGRQTTDVDWNALPPDAETPDQLRRRAAAFVDAYLVGRFPAEARVLIVSHHLLVNALLELLAGQPIDIGHHARHVALSVVELDQTGGLVRLHALGSVAHLAEAAPA